MTILDALSAPNLLGTAFPEAGTWQTWRTLLAGGSRSP